MMKILLKNHKQDMYLIDLCKEYYFSKDLIKKLKKAYDMYELIKKDESKEIILPKESTTVIPSSGPLDIVYEDEHLLILNKESGLSTIPSKLHYVDNLSSRIKNYLPDSGIHIITRLDRPTSGLVLIAKHQYIQGLFSKKQIQIDKKYLAKVSKDFPYSNITVEKNIARVGSSMLREVNDNGEYAKTDFKIIKKHNDYTLVEATLYTGRTHQIRVHLQYLGYPIIGDDLYSTSKGEFFLQCFSLNFIHPITNKKLKITLKQ